MNKLVLLSLLLSIQCSKGLELFGNPYVQTFGVVGFWIVLNHYFLNHTFHNNFFRAQHYIFGSMNGQEMKHAIAVYNDAFQNNVFCAQHCIFWCKSAQAMRDGITILKQDNTFASLTRRNQETIVHGQIDRSTRNTYIRKFNTIIYKLFDSKQARNIRFYSTTLLGMALILYCNNYLDNAK